MKLAKTLVFFRRICYNCFITYKIYIMGKKHGGNISVKKIHCLLIFILSIYIALGSMATVVSAPTEVTSYYGFQPNGIAYHYYSFGDEAFFNVLYDGNNIGAGERMPYGTDIDEWLRETMRINGSDRFTNIRYKQDITDKSQYPQYNQDMPFQISIPGQNGPAIFKDDIFTVYMQPDANLLSPEINIILTSIGNTRFPGLGFITSGNISEKLLTNDTEKKEELAKLFKMGTDFKTDNIKRQADLKTFSNLFDSSLKDEFDLSKETWLIVRTWGISGHGPAFGQYKIICIIGNNPYANIPITIPREAVFDKRLLYQSNIIFNFLQYTKTPVSILVNGNNPPDGACVFDKYMLVINKSYLADLPSDCEILIAVQFDDGSEDSVKVSITDTTNHSYIPVFIDVGTDTTAWEFINPLAKMGIIEEKDGDKYFPEQIITWGEFCDMLANAMKLQGNSVAALKNAGVLMEEPASMTDEITTLKAEELLFNAVTSEHYKKQYNKLNELHLNNSNVWSDLTIENFEFFANGKKDEITRADAVEVIYKFVRLVEYASEPDDNIYRILNPNTGNSIVKTLLFLFFGILFGTKIFIKNLK